MYAELKLQRITLLLNLEPIMDFVWFCGPISLML